MVKGFLLNAAEYILSCFVFSHAKGGKQVSPTFLFPSRFFFSLLCLFRRQLSETWCCFHWRPHSFSLTLSLAPRCHGKSPEMGQITVQWGSRDFGEGLEGGSKFLGPVLSNHQALFDACKLRKLSEEKKKENRKWVEKWEEGTNLLTEVKCVCAEWAVVQKTDTWPQKTGRSICVGSSVSTRCNFKRGKSRLKAWWNMIRTVDILQPEELLSGIQKKSAW